MSEPMPEDYVEDDVIWPLMVRLRDCLCAELTQSGLMPGDCFCGVLPGDQVIWDYKEGMAWVRLANEYPTTTFPTIDNRPRGGCPPSVGATLEVGVLHCAPGIKGTKRLPTQAEQFEATRLQMATKRAIHRAIACCGFDPMVLGSYSPLGPQGGLVGGQWLVDIGPED